MTNNRLEEQLKDWNEIHRYMIVAGRIPYHEQAKFIEEDLKPLIEEYKQKYNQDYDHLKKPK